MQPATIRRLLLLVGIVALAVALLLTVLPLLLRAAPVVDIFPLEPGVLDLPVPTAMLSAAPAVMSSPTTTPLPVQAATRIPSVAVLQQGLEGYNGCVDTYIQIYLPDDNFCQSPELSVGTSNKAGLLLRFDLTGLPDSVIGLNSASVIQEARLALYAVQGRADTVIGAYLLRREWEACAVTWNQPWQEPSADGAQDRDSEPWSEAAAERAPSWLEFDVTGLVQDWLRDPGNNYGLIIKSFEAALPSHHIFFASDHPAVSSRPKLTIKYEPVAPTRTPVPQTATPTAEPTATPGQPLARRVVEVHWRDVMNVGNPYLVTVGFRLATAQAAPAATSQLYNLSVAAHLTAPGFDVASDSPAEQTLEDLIDPLSWSWTVTPRIVGSQVISLDLLFAWKPALGAGAVTAVEPGVWYWTKTVKVEKAFATWTQLEAARNVMAILGLICVAGSYLLKKRGGQA